MYYTSYGTKWGDPDFGTESGQIYWSSDLTSGLRFGAGDSVSEFDGKLQSAFDAWESVSGLDFTYVSSGASDITVIVDAMPLNYSDSVVGYANWSDNGATITSGTLTFDKEEFWAPNGEGSGTVDFFAVALHEIGHLIGLDHYIPSPGDPAQIMNSSISAGELKSGDIAGAQYIYGAGDGATPPPTPPQTPAPPEPVEPVEPGDPPADPVSPEEEVPPVAADDGGSSSSGAIGAIIGLLGLVVAMLFGGGAGFVGLAAGRVAEGDDDDDNADEEAHEFDDVLLTDLLPVAEAMSHAVYVDDLGNFIADPNDHDHDHEEEDDLFLV